MGRKAVCCVVKNEERDIAEWIAFHIHVGFDTVIVYDNLSADRTAEVALTFRRHYDVRVIPWERRDPGYQIDAYTDAISRFGDEFEWMLFIDSDEFLIQEDLSAGKLSFLDDFPESVSQICLNWSMFDSSGHKDFPDGLIIEKFIHRLPLEHPTNRHVKSFVRPRRVRRPLQRIFGCFYRYVPHPLKYLFSNTHAFLVKGRTTNIEKCDIDYRIFKFKPIVMSPKPIHSVAWINHYWTRSEAHWRLKVSRGYRGMIPPRTMDDFFNFDREATVRDTRALPHARGVRLILEKAGLSDRPGAQDGLRFP